MIGKKLAPGRDPGKLVFRRSSRPIKHLEPQSVQFETIGALAACKGAEFACFALPQRLTAAAGVDDEALRPYKRRSA